MPKGVPNKRYTPEFKRKVVETIEKENLSIRAAMQEFGINDHKIIERWERIYLEEGPEGLAIERRGRSSKGRPPKQLPKQVEEDLLAEVQRLRAENDYLKNLQALLLFIGFKPLEFFDNIYFELGTDPHALLPSDYGEFAIIKSRYSAISVSQIFGIVASSIASS